MLWMEDMNSLRKLWIVSIVLLVGHSVAFGQAQPFSRGDFDASGAVDVADPIVLLAYLFQGTDEPVCFDAADVNDDGSVEISDGIQLLSFLFASGPAPAAPGACGLDPTADNLDCQEFPPCPPVGESPIAVFLRTPATGEAPLEVFFDAADSFDPDGFIVSYEWDFGDGAVGSGETTSHTFTTVGSYDVVLTVTDDMGLSTHTVEAVTIGSLAPFVIESTSPFPEEIGVALSRETIVRFSGPVLASTITDTAIQAHYGDVPVAIRLQTPQGEATTQQATIFYEATLPGDTTIEVDIDGDLLLDSLGRPVDVDADGIPGGQYTLTFVTLSLTQVEGTVVTGRVFASEPDFAMDGTSIDVPLAGVTITVDGIDPAVLSAVTDDMGDFCLEPAPAGRFFVHIDGHTVPIATIDGLPVPTSFPGGPFYPNVGKTWETQPGQESQIEFVYLPLVREGALTSISATDPTLITLPDAVLDAQPELDGLHIVVPPDAVYADDGTRCGSVGLGVVAPDRLPGTPPPGLDFSLVVTVQAAPCVPGDPIPTNFDPPVSICFPNLDGLAPGASASLASFNHDSGQWEVVGSMTVSIDGNTICTDPGVGILAPGWHGVCGCRRADVWVTGAGSANLSMACHQAGSDADGCEGNEIGEEDGLSAADCVAEGSAKVILNTGEEILRRVDLAIVGRGEAHFTFTRTYRSRLLFDGPLGHGWDHEYNERFFEQPNGDLIRSNGGGRVDRWVFDDGKYVAPTGYYRRLFKEPDGTLVAIEPNGFRRRYGTDGRLQSHEDRNGNSLLFYYDGVGNLDRVIDPYGREVSFRYQEIAGRDRIVRMRDFVGREVRYVYDEQANLIAVRSPRVVGTSIGNDFSQGRTEKYAYSSGFSDPRLNHNIVALTAPQEVAVGGPPSITWEYGTDPSDPASYDKVVAESLGGGLVNESGVPAGGTMTFEYSVLNEAEPLGQLEIPRGKVRVTERNGNVYEAFANERGQHVLTRRFTRVGLGQAALRPGEPSFYDTRFVYDAEGKLLREIRPEGNEIVHTYEASGPRRSQRNRIATRRVADPGRGGGEDLVTTTVHEPLYNQVLRTTGPRGNASGFVPPIGSPSPERYTTCFYYDYQEGEDYAGLAQRLGLSESEVIDLLLDSGVPMGLGDLNDDGRTDQISGNLIRVEAPSVQLRPDSMAATLPSLVTPLCASLPPGVASQSIVSEVAYNDHGQKIRSIDAEGNVTLFQYHSATDPDGDGDPVSTFYVVLDPNETSGYLSERVVDAESSYRRTSPVPPTSLVTRIRYDQVGNQTATIDPRGVVRTVEYNALNEAVLVTRGAEVSEALASGQLLTGESAFAFRSRSFYDHNGRVVRRERENRDGSTAGVGEFVEENLVYDLLNNVVESRIEVDAGQFLSTQFRYDPNEQLVLTVEPEGNSVQTEYDERNLIFRTTRGLGSPEVATTQADYDLNGNLVRTIDAEDNDGDGVPESRTQIYDGFDRLVEIVDALGNRTVTTLDVASQAIGVARFGHPAGDPAGANVLLARSTTAFDELGRAFRSDREVFVAPGNAPLVPIGPVDLLSDHDGDGIVTEFVEFDALGRQFRSVQDDGQERLTFYDGVSRVVEGVDAVGNRTLTEYDRNSNVTRVTSVEVSNAGGVSQEAFATSYVYDQLNRMVRLTDNAGHTTRFEYDSHDNLVRQSDARGQLGPDPLGLYSNEINANGNITRFRYDGANRLLAKVIELTADGEGGSPLDSANSEIEVTYEYDDNSRLVRVRDDNSNSTFFEYDHLNRRNRRFNADGTVHEFFFDRDSNVVRTIDEKLNDVVFQYDALNRLVQATVVSFGTGTVGTGIQVHEYDGLSRVTRSVDDNGATGGDAEVVWVYDSLSRVIEERQNGAPVASRYRGDGVRTRCIYPNGRSIDSTFDEIDRVIQMSDQSGAIVTGTDWVGPGYRLVERLLGNGTRTSYLDDNGMLDGYDLVPREQRLRHRDELGVAFVDRESSYNRGNDRTSVVRHDDLGLSDSFTFDSTHRLLESSYEGFDRIGSPGLLLLGQSYELDGVGNRVEVLRELSTGFMSLPYASNEMNEYVTIDGVGRVHDENGNLTVDAGKSFHFDSWNRLVRVDDVATGQPIAAYRYDALDRRTRRTIYDASGGVTEEISYVYDGIHCVEEGALVAGTTTTYVYGVGADDIVQRVHGTGVPSDEALYYHRDSRGDVVAITGTNGEVVEEYRYTDFGNREGSASAEVAHLFQGRRWDPETGLYHFRARYYDPNTGRFVQRDPLDDPINLGNAYTYAGNGPTSLSDPLGTKASDGGFFSMLASPFVKLWGFVDAVGDAVLSPIYDVYAGWIATENALQVADDMARLRPQMGGMDAWGYAQVELGRRGMVLHGLDQAGEAAGRSQSAMLESMLAGGPASVGLSRARNAMPSTFSRRSLPKVGSRHSKSMSTGGTDSISWAIARSTGRGGGLANYRRAPLPAHTGGVTTPNGDVYLNSNLTSWAQRRAVLRHESVHAFFAVPDGAFLAGPRQRLDGFFYHNSTAFSATEEFLAEAYAQRSLKAGWRHAFSGAYTGWGGQVTVSPALAGLEAAAGVLTVANLGVVAYIVGRPD